MKQINSTNIEEILYELGGSRMTDACWFKQKWWDIKFAWAKRQERKLAKHLRKFLLEDIQNLRYHKLNFRRLRYLDVDGVLKSAMFKVWYKYGSFYIKPYSGGIPLVANKPKGPMKFRQVECSAINYKWFGLQEIPTWEVHFYSSL